ncbi:hypothetical protein KRMM14A1004_40000 [Krasilnikovia sp. MM14-A1004]
MSSPSYGFGIIQHPLHWLQPGRLEATVTDGRGPAWRAAGVSEAPANRVLRNVLGRDRLLTDVLLRLVVPGTSSGVTPQQITVGYPSLNITIVKGATIRHGRDDGLSAWLA